jgi:hypothetical protein
MSNAKQIENMKTGIKLKRTETGMTWVIVDFNGQAFYLKCQETGILWRQSFSVLVGKISSGDFQIVNPVSFQQKYGSVTINSLINYKESLAKKANRLNESFSEYIKEFYGY